MKKVNWKIVAANVLLFVLCLIINMVSVAILSSASQLLQVTEGLWAELVRSVFIILNFLPVMVAALFGGAVHGVIISFFSLSATLASYNLIFAVVVLVCSVIRKREKFRDYIIGSAVISLTHIIVGGIGIDLGIVATITGFIFCFACALAMSSVYYFIDRKFSAKLSALFPKNKIVVMHKNYRKRSIKKELIIIINTVTLICFAILASFSFSTFTNSYISGQTKDIDYLRKDILKEIPPEDLDTGKALSDNSELLAEMLTDYDVCQYVEYMYICRNTFAGEFYTENSQEYIEAVSVVSETDEYGWPVSYTLNRIAADEIKKFTSDNYYIVELETDTNLNISDTEYNYESIYIGVIMNRAILDEFNYFLMQIIYLFITLLIYVNIFANWRINKRLAEPISDMTDAVAKFAFTDEKARNELKEKFDSLSITTGDEIEVLYMAYGKTMADMASYIDDIDAKSRQIAKFQHNIIVTMADIIESRDENTGGHIKRTAAYVEIIARKLQSDGKYPETLTDEYINDMIVAAPLHDMGKIHVSDTILNKNGRLTDEEFSIMKSHTTAGKEMLCNATETLGVFSYLSVAIDMANSHHEWWNGGGYPEGKSGEDIPLCARIMAVADVFDALISKRCYKAAMPLEKAYSIIREETGTHFDPVVSEAFFASLADIEKALEEFED